MAEKISKKINKMYENLFKTQDNIHPFFKDLNKVYDQAPKHKKHVKDAIKKKINYKIINELPQELNINPKYEVLNNNELKKLDNEIFNVLNYEKIYELVAYISKFLIRSNINNENELYDKISKNKKEEKDTINVMIIGSGPVGLFLACYLHLYYNLTSMNSSPRVNIVMYDSRIEKGGFRKPYNRQRLFATASKYLTLILPKVYCWNNKDYFMVNIFLLEYALFTVANHKYNIPMIYEDYDWEDYKKIITKGNFDVVFDCTGGRLNHDVINISNIDASWLNKINLSNSNINREITVDKENNLVFIENDKEHIYNYFYGSMEIIHSNDKILTFHSKYDIDINNGTDLMHLNNAKNKYYKYKDAINIISGIKDDTNRNFLYTMLHNHNNYIIKFDVWGIYMRHQIKISDVVNINNKKILFIGAGDTIFHSHFITGAGLNRIFDFTVKCANKIADLKEL
jgi:hypothetical protein